MHHFFTALEKGTHNTIDHTIFERLARGDEEAFGVVVHTLYKKLFLFTVSLVRSENEADDIMQEVFLKIWLHRSSLTAIENPFGWICRIIANTASNHLRSSIRRELNSHRFNSQLAHAEEIEGGIDAKFTQSLIDEAVSLLPPKRKLVFLLNKKEGLSRKEIAERLNISEHTVRNQLAEAIQFIRERLNYKGDLTILSLLILFHIS
ncbi:RNA polymerase sigma-70 factor [Agriterribacter sp.]|uniref:RNA polymerase sigma factor n=1 Tax=Agriterribacter sp. TaxID=2821509 RepID=UPI002CEF82D1|nr:RNA polymerase sigma-70 factor [Agriterribacter sp.]HRP55479.1 RNA polymerase sigma-70 factor [Agriterribacter sp.]